MARKRVLPQARTRRVRPQAALARTAATQLVYVHGICRHEAGYSDPWWAALKPFVPDIPDENRHEVLWSDLITGSAAVSPAVHAERMASAARSLAQPFGDRAHPGLGEHIKEVLADRAQRQLVEASLRTAGPEAQVLATPLANLDLVGPQALFTIPGLECVDDFLQYLVDDNTRNQVIGRFNQVVQPLLAAGNKLEIISHSWGTVIAYEALRRLDPAPNGQADQPIHNLFTVGSALSIGPVKRSLIPEAADGKRPALVRNWVNLNARFDIVGGHLRGNPFAVDYEYLDLQPVGCSTLIPNPVCAHGSYFNPQNLVVNQRIFGNFIEGAGIPMSTLSTTPAVMVTPVSPAQGVPMAREARFFLRAAAPERNDLQAAKREWSDRLLKPQAVTPHVVRAFMAAVSPAPEHNVVAVGIDEKYTDDAPTGIRCIKFLVKAKFPESRISPKHLLPKQISGLPTDIEEVGLLVPYAKAPPRKRRARERPQVEMAPTNGAMPDPKKRFRPAQPGCSVGFADPNNQFVMAGTFGLLVKDSQGRYILSNNHVLANENALPTGAPIYQPGLLDQGNPATDQIAELTRFVPLTSQGMNKVDAALAKLLASNLARPDILFIGAPKGTGAAAEDMVVHKFGRTTAYRVGRVSSVDFDVKIPYDIGMVKFQGQIAIRGLNGQRFSDQGDSGSAILDRETGQVVGLLFGGRTDGTLTFANPIDDVLQALGVTLV